MANLTFALYAGRKVIRYIHLDIQLFSDLLVTLNKYVIWLS